MMRQIKSFKNIIFDLGNVIVPLDYTLTTKGFEQLGFKDWNRNFYVLKEQKVFENIEKGLISEAEFLVALRPYMPSDVTDLQILNAWGAMLTDFPVERVDLVRKLRESHRVFLLSNTNQPHIDYFKALFRKKYNYEMSELFEIEFYSNDLKLAKPHSDIYYKALEIANIKAEETLFIDDLIENIEGANKTGIHGYWLHDETIVDVFSKLWI